jgi:hypothetical protein
MEGSTRTGGAVRGGRRRRWTKCRQGTSPTAPTQDPVALQLAAGDALESERVRRRSSPRGRHRPARDKSRRRAMSNQRYLRPDTGDRPLGRRAGRSRGHFVRRPRSGTCPYRFLTAQYLRADVTGPATGRARCPETGRTRAGPFATGSTPVVPRRLCSEGGARCPSRRADASSTRERHANRHAPRQSALVSLSETTPDSLRTCRPSCRRASDRRSTRRDL